MYCNVCGAENPEGSKFCSACGIPMLIRKGKQIQQNNEAERIISEDEYFAKSWRSIMSAPISFATMILYSLCVLITAINTKELMNSLSAILTFFGEASSLRDNLMYFAIVAPGAVTAIGMWMLYAEAFKPQNTPLFGTGLRIIMIMNIISLLIFGVGIVVILTKLSEYGNTEEYNAIIDAFCKNYTWEIIQMVVIVILFIVTKVETIIMLERMYDSVSYGYVSVDYIGVVAILQFVLGGWLIYLLPSFGFSLSGSIPALLCLVMPFIWGGMLLRYKSRMCRTECEIQEIAEKMEETFAEGTWQ